jgi:hypothetical protein
LTTIVVTISLGIAGCFQSVLLDDCETVQGVGDKTATYPQQAYQSVSNAMQNRSGGGAQDHKAAWVAFRTAAEPFCNWQRPVLSRNHRNENGPAPRQR